MAQNSATYDIVVLGAGSGGYSAALRGAQLGLEVALVEESRLGGTCLHEGCIPTKALLHVAEAADTIAACGALGVHATFHDVDPVGVRKFTEKLVSRLHRGLEGLVGAEAKIARIPGRGVLTGPGTVAVDGKEITGRNVVIATGARANGVPEVPFGSRVLDSAEALEKLVIPRSVVIVGGSVIGLEFASAWKSLGADVTVVEALDSLLPAEDTSVSTYLRRAMRKRGIDIRTGVGVESVIEGAEEVEVVLADGTSISAEYALIAVGRSPNIDHIGLDAAGVKTDGMWIATNAHLRTSVPSIWAVGDVVRGPQLAHRGFAHGIFVAETLAGLAPDPVDDSVIPRITYSDPEVASVGITEAQAREKYGDSVTIQEYNLAGNGKSQILGTNGIVKIVQAPGGHLLGVHMVGSRMGEQIGEASLLVNLGVPADEVSALIHAHPTQNESLGEALMALSGKPLHMR